MQIESLRQYIIIDSASLVVRVMTRKEAGTWKFTELTGAQDKVLIEAIDFESRLQILYEGVEL